MKEGFAHIEIDMNDDGLAIKNKSCLDLIEGVMIIDALANTIAHGNKMIKMMLLGMTFSANKDGVMDKQKSIQIDMGAIEKMMNESGAGECSEE